MNTPNFADSIADLIRELGGEMLQHTAVVVGSTAIYLASPATARLPHDLDLSIPEDIYQRFRLLPSWQSTETTYRTKNILRNNKCDIGVGWGGMSHAALQKRSWQTPQGLHVVNIASLYSWKQSRQASKDKRDAAAIYHRLHDTPLLPLDIMYHESAQLAACLPRQLQHKSELLRLATHGSLASFVRHHQPHQIHPQTSIQNLTVLSYPIDSFTKLAKRIGQSIAHPELTELPLGEQEIALLGLIYSDAIHPSPTPHHSLAKLASDHSLIGGFTAARAHRLASLVSEIHSKKQPSDPLPSKILAASQAAISSL